MRSSLGSPFFYFFLLLSLFQTSVLAQASTCSIKPGEPAALQDGAIKVNSYDTLAQDANKCIADFKSASGQAKRELFAEIKSFSEELAKHIDALEKYKARLDSGSEKETIAAIDSSLKKLVETKLATEHGYIEDLTGYLAGIDGLDSSEKSCLSAVTLPEEKKTENGKTVWQNYSNTKTQIDNCLDGQDDNYLRDAALEENLTRLNELQKLFKSIDARYTSLLKSWADVKSSDDENEKTSFKTAYAELEKIRNRFIASFLAGMELKLAHVSVFAEAQSCNDTLAAIEDINNTNQYLKKIKTYADACEVAIKRAIQNNNSPLLGKLRENVKDSIKNIDVSSKALSSFSQLQHGDDKNIAEVRSSIIHFSSASQDDLEKLRKLAGEDSALPLLANWRSEPFTHQFYAGIEAADVEGFSEKASARAGMLAYLRPGKKLHIARKIVQDCHDEKNASWYNPCGVRNFFWPHWYIKGDYSSAGEVSQDDTETGVPPDTVQSEVDTSLEWESGIFWPVYYGARAGVDDDGKINPLKSEFMIGPIYSRGARKVSGGDFLNRYYRGLRMAFNEETWFDIMQGYSEGVYGPDGNLNERWEIRGQYPVSKLGLGRIFVGGNVNFGHDDKGLTSEQKKDSYSVYVMWQTSFDDLWSGAKSKE